VAGSGQQAPCPDTAVTAGQRRSGAIGCSQDFAQGISCQQYVLLQALAPACLLPRSVLVEQLQLLQPERPLWQAVQFAAAVAAVGTTPGLPLLIVDPWQLMSALLFSTAGGGSAAAGQWQLVSPSACCTNMCTSPIPQQVSTSSSSKSARQVQAAECMLDVLSASSAAPLDSGCLAQVGEALAAGCSVCLQLCGCSTETEQQLLRAAAAQYALLQLRQPSEAGEKESRTADVLGEVAGSTREGSH